MLVLVLNCGSSSVKYALYDWAKSTILTQGNIERIGAEGGQLIIKWLLVTCCQV